MLMIPGPDLWISSALLLPSCRKPRGSGRFMLGSMFYEEEERGRERGGDGERERE